MIIGIIGGIGSGKSTAADCLKNEFSFEKIETDRIAKDVMDGNDELKEELMSAFGKDIYLPDGTLDRKRYSDIIFKSDRNRELSDMMVHPFVWKAVRMRIAEEMRRQPQDELRLTVETAIPDRRFPSLCDEVWFIYADRETRIRRLCGSRGYSREHAEAVMDRQPSDEEYLVLSDRMVKNEGSVTETAETVRSIIHELTERKSL